MWRLVFLSFFILQYLPIIFSVLRTTVLQLRECKLSGMQFIRMNFFVDLRKERACSRKLGCRIIEFLLLKEKDSRTFQSLWIKNSTKLKFNAHGKLEISKEVSRVL